MLRKCLSGLAEVSLLGQEGRRRPSDIRRLNPTCPEAESLTLYCAQVAFKPGRLQQGLFDEAQTYGACIVGPCQIKGQAQDKGGGVTECGGHRHDESSIVLRVPAWGATCLALPGSVVLKRQACRATAAMRKSLLGACRHFMPGSGRVQVLRETRVGAGQRVGVSA